MHVCMVLWKQFPRDIRVEKEARALRAAGHDVTLLCRRADDRPRRETIQGVDVRRVDEGDLSATHRAGLTLRYLATIVHPFWRDRLLAADADADTGFDAIHVHDLPLVATGLDVADHLDVPVVADLHENYPAALRQWRRMHDWRTVATSKSLLAEYALRPIRRYERIETRCVRRADRVLTPCEEGRRHYVEDCGADADSVAVVGNTVDLTHFDADADPVEGLDDDFVVSYVGKYAPHRGLEALVRGFADVTDERPNARLLVVGAPASDAYGDRFERVVRHAGVADAVTFTGWVDFERVPEYVAASDVCVVPHQDTTHTNTTIPHKLFQYMAAGKPVLVSDVPPLERVVTDADAGVVARAGDPNSFADALVTLATEPARRDRLGRNARRAVGETYNWERDGERLVRTYAAFD